MVKKKKIASVDDIRLPTSARKLKSKHQPFANQKEYVRAQNAAKVKQLLAKPFIHAMDDHKDSVISLRKHPKSSNFIISGACDGELRIWDVQHFKSLSAIKAHEHWVTGICFVPSQPQRFLSSSRDGFIKLWDMPYTGDILSGQSDFMGKHHDLPGSYGVHESHLASKILSFHSGGAINDLDVSATSNQFVTAGSSTQLWDITRTAPISHIGWNSDSSGFFECTTTAIRFNRSETNLVCVCDYDGYVTLCDTRTKKGFGRFKLDDRPNCCEFNPRNPTEFIVGSDSGKCRLFSIKNLKRAKQVYEGHTNAVLSVDWSPLGSDFVSGSMDGTIRLWDTRTLGKSRDLYHTRRMGRVNTVQYSVDSRVVYSGSEDCNVRAWRAHAAVHHTKQMNAREQAAKRYSDSLIKKYIDMPDIRKIQRQKFVPKHVKSAQKKRREQREREVEKSRHKYRSKSKKII
ncbi:wd40 repeat-like protein [Aduncisulcus paluster]|uniref:DDB1- and CUL4-associated factor 13 n=1 Tax=Aduncisulcus paluster TaxID=2918883 RepID=A0ABQ5JZI6_9EUKA|nr:wd40 repeat-like protein [Aduncisulcus paluster]|eukprot:gnl/Carplike_NY0171/5257_a7174_348.p1 GENE.gnl/Carplike_NY0171/5257_a7174_348~~gnl/Carplike_NY0171/5257_a7174_348.p1  ORF type:complete len:458 (+),score=75.04 gnl/Carplike_NY0171/5257_a7174_348:11-1384(+)